MRVPSGPDCKPHNTDQEEYLQQLLNYVVLTNRITNDVAAIGNLGCEAAIYIRYYYLKRFNNLPYAEFKKMFTSPKGTHRTRQLPDIASLIRHLCVADNSMPLGSQHQTNNSMDADYAAIRRRANIKTKHNIKYRTHLFEDLVDKYMWFFRLHVIQSAKLLMIAYYEAFYFTVCHTSKSVTDDTTPPPQPKDNFDPDAYELLNLEVLIAALFNCPKQNRQTDSILLSSNINRALYHSYRAFFHQMFPDETLMPDIETRWYAYVPFLLRIQKILLNAQPKQQLETLFPCFIDTRHYVKYDDRAIVELLNATNLYLPTKAAVMLNYAPSTVMQTIESTPYWGKLTQHHCKQFFECGPSSSNENEQAFCNFVTDGVICYRMQVNNKDICRSKPTHSWSNNCCTHQYSNRRNLISLDEFHNPASGHYSIYNYGSNLIADYEIHCEDKLLRMQLSKLKAPTDSSPTNSLCSRCKKFML